MFECTKANYPTVEIPNDEPFVAYTLFELAAIAHSESIKRYGIDDSHLSCIVCSTSKMGTVLRVFTHDGDDNDVQFEIDLNGQ